MNGRANALEHECTFALQYIYADDDNAMPGQDSRRLPDSSNFTLLQCEGINRNLIFDSDQIHINELVVYKGVIIGVKC